MDALGGIFILLTLIGAVVWVFCMAGQGVQSINRTGKAIGKWNDEKLKDKK